MVFTRFKTPRIVFVTRFADTVGRASRGACETRTGADVAECRSHEWSCRTPVREPFLHSTGAVALMLSASKQIQEITMPDDPSKTGSDRKLIALEQEHEVRTWTASLGCSEEKLREAVKAVGNSADAVRAYLARQR